MSPEQLAGADIDARSDIFALGAVLYEMVTGRRAFAGNSRASLIAAIMATQPEPIPQIQPLTPPALAHVIDKCMAKDPELRWQSAQDVAAELRWISEAGSSAGLPAPAVRRRKRIELMGWIVAGLLVAAFAIFLRFRPVLELPRVETAITAPDGGVFRYEGSSLALSPDGRQLAFVARVGTGPHMLWVRELRSSHARVVAETENATSPFWSPDGKFIAFEASGKLKKVDISGGRPQVVLELPRFVGGSWLEGGDLLVATLAGIQRLSGDGKPETTVLKGGTSPIALGDGRFLFVEFRSGARAVGVYVATIDGKNEKLVVPGVYSQIQWVPRGFILYARDDEIRAQKVNPRTMERIGDSFTVASGVTYDPDSKSGIFSVDERGGLVYLRGGRAGMTELVWLDRAGKELEVVTPPAMYYTPRLSRDETRVAVDLSDDQTATGDIWIFDLTRKVSTRLSYDPRNESAPVWSADNQTIYYFVDKEGQLDLYQRSAGGTGAEKLLLSDRSYKIPSDVSPDGRFLAYGSRSPDRTADFWLLDLQTGKPSPLLVTPFAETGLQFSPDGKWIAYGSDESGRTEIYVQDYPERKQKAIVSRGGGVTPAWRGDGKELYYRASDGKLVAIAVSEKDGQLVVGEPAALFDLRVRTNFPFRQYAPSRDGMRFLVNRTVAEEGSQPVTYVQNWMSGVE